MSFNSMKKLFLSITLILAGVTLTLATQYLLTNNKEQEVDDISIQQKATLNIANGKKNYTSMPAVVSNTATVAQKKSQTINVGNLGVGTIKISDGTNVKNNIMEQNSAKEIEQSIEQRFAREETDYEWKMGQEDKIFNLLSDNILGEDAWTEKTECKSSLCKIEINYSLSAIPLITETLRLLSESEGDTQGTSYDLTNMESEKGYNEVVLFHIRKK